jgi:hypothetical protein
MRPLPKKLNRRLALLGFLVLLIAFLFPQDIGLLLPGGRVPIWVGRYHVGINRDGGPILLMALSRCVRALRGWVPPYDSMTVDVVCDSPSGSHIPDRMQIDIYGEEKSVDSDAYAEASVEVFVDRKTPISESPLPGYREFRGHNTELTPPPTSG